MDKQLNDKVEGILASIKPSLAGADIRLKDINQETVTLEYSKALSNPSACHVNRTKMTKELLSEILQDRLKEVMPDLKEITILGEE